MLNEDKTQTYSRSIIINHKPSGKVNIGVVVSLSFNNSKLLSHDSDHLNFDFFWVKEVNGDAIDENTSTNLQ